MSGCFRINSRHSQYKRALWPCLGCHCSGLNRFAKPKGIRNSESFLMGVFTPYLFHLQCFCTRWFCWATGYITLSKLWNERLSCITWGTFKALLRESPATRTPPWKLSSRTRSQSWGFFFFCFVLVGCVQICGFVLTSAVSFWLCFADLWVCLLCRRLGCGRFSRAHALSHFEETLKSDCIPHSLVMSLNSLQCWLTSNSLAFHCQTFCPWIAPFEWAENAVN